MRIMQLFLLPFLFTFFSNQPIHNNLGLEKIIDLHPLGIANADTLQLLKIDYESMDCQTLRSKFKDDVWADALDIEEYQLAQNRLWECKVEAENTKSEDKSGKQCVVILTEDVDEKSGKAIFVSTLIDVTTGDVAKIASQLKKLATFKNFKGDLKNLIITSTLGPLKIADFIKSAPKNLGVCVLIPLPIKNSILTKEIYDTIKREKIDKVLRYTLMVPAEKAAKEAQRTARRIEKQAGRSSQQAIDESRRVANRISKEQQRFAKKVGNFFGF